MKERQRQNNRTDKYVHDSNAMTARTRMRIGSTRSERGVTDGARTGESGLTKTTICASVTGHFHDVGYPLT